MKELRRHTDHPVGLILILVGLMILASPVFEPVVSAQSPATTPGWTFTGSLNADRFGHTATLLKNGKVLAVFVKNPSTSGLSAELYDPGTGSWTSADTPTNLGVLRPLFNGKILSVSRNSSELYDAATGKWTSAVGLNVI